MLGTISLTPALTVPHCWKTWNQGWPQPASDSHSVALSGQSLEFSWTAYGVAGRSLSPRIANVGRMAGKPGGGLGIRSAGAASG